MPFDRAELDRLVLPVDWAEQLNAAARAKLLAKWAEADKHGFADENIPRGLVFEVSLEPDSDTEQSQE